MPSSSQLLPSVSIIVVAHNEREHLARTVDALLATTPGDREVIVVDDHSTDDCAAGVGALDPTVRVVGCQRRLGGAAARNLGARYASGDLLAFSDAHVETPAGWVSKLATALAPGDVGAVAPAISSLNCRNARGFGLTWQAPDMTLRWLPRQGTGPYSVPLVSACFLAMRAERFFACGGFDEALTPWGGTDAELGMRLWTLGYECRVVPEVTVAHLFRRRFPYAVAGEDVLHNRLRVAMLHLTGRRLALVLDTFRHRQAFPRALARVLDGDAWQRREELRLRRRHDDEWFCNRFGIECLTTSTREEAA